MQVKLVVSLAVLESESGARSDRLDVKAVDRASHAETTPYGRICFPAGSVIIRVSLENRIPRLSAVGTTSDTCTFLLGLIKKHWLLAIISRVYGVHHRHNGPGSAIGHISIPYSSIYSVGTIIIIALVPRLEKIQ